MLNFHLYNIVDYLLFLVFGFEIAVYHTNAFNYYGNQNNIKLVIQAISDIHMHLHFTLRNLNESQLNGQSQ